MAKQLKQRNSMQLFVQIVLLLVEQVLITNALTLIPSDPSQLNNWFQVVVKPFSARKGKLDPHLVEAESTMKIIKVRKDGSGQFKTIADAVKSIDNANTNRVIISIGPGQYKEKLTIGRNKQYITFYGDPNNKPILTFDGTAAEYGTVDSATLIVDSDYFVGVNLIIANSAPRPDGKRKGAQAAAMRISGDKATFYNCRFTGFQDTICDDKGNHFFKDCYIEGTVDFIFGEGRSLYLNTEIHVIPGDPIAIIAAHARKNEQGVGGYSFVHCKVTGKGGNAFLGRAWMKAARVVYSYCTMSDVVEPQGWSDNFRPPVQKTVFFGEYSNKGPGAAKTGRVKYAKQLTNNEAQQFISMEYIDAFKWLLPPPMV